MFNAFNGQHQGNQAGWLGNLQGNYSAPTVPNSYPRANGYQGHHDPYAHYGAFPPQPGWQPHDPALVYQHQQHHPQMQQYNYQYYAAPAPTEPQQPPLPDGAPPPLPPTPAEPPPPLPPDFASPAPPPPPETQILNQPPQPFQSQGPPQGHGSTGYPAPEPWGAAQFTGHPPGGAPIPPTHPGAPWSQHLQHQQHMQQQQHQPYPQMGYAGPNNPYAAAFQQQPPPVPQPAASLPPQVGYSQQQQQQPGAQAPGSQPPRQHQSAVQPPGAGGGGMPQYTTGGAQLTSHQQQHHHHLPPAAAPGPSAPPGPAAAPAPVVVDITRLIRPPHRATRPRKLLLVLRGLPGSGKSTLARKIREAEVEAGAEVPRLHSIDDYYMQDVDVEVVEEEGGRKKRRKVTELKYVYEPEMEGTYFRDLVRAVGRSCEDRRYNFVVVDAPVLRAEQLREVMSVGQRANFECFALLPLETDPAVCASAGRNTHGHSLETLKEMAARFEPAPPLYAQVSGVSLFGGLVVGEENGAGGGGAARSRSRSGGEIQEIEMDMEDSQEDDDSGGNGGGRDGSGDGDDAAGPRGRRATSRWHEEGDEGRDGEEGEGAGRRHRKKKRGEKAKLRAVADIDDKDILSGLNDALAAAPNGSGAPAAAPPPPLAPRRPPGPLRSALRRSSSAAAAAVPTTAATAAVAVGANFAVMVKRSVWWPDLGQGVVGPAPSPTAAAVPAPDEEEAATAVATATAQLVQVVYLEGLGPPAELEDLPYGYQRRGRGDAGGAAAASGGAAGGGGGEGAVATAGPARPGAVHGPHSFREQAKAEHESEHDLFRRLLLGKMSAQGQGQGQGAWKAGGSAPAPLGLFAAPDDGEEEDS